MHFVIVLGFDSIIILQYIIYTYETLNDLKIQIYFCRNQININVLIISLRAGAGRNNQSLDVSKTCTIIGRRLHGKHGRRKRHGHQEAMFVLDNTVRVLNGRHNRRKRTLDLGHFPLSILPHENNRRYMNVLK